MKENRAWLAILRVAAGAVWLFQAYPKFRQDYLSQRFAQEVSAMAGSGNPWHFYANFLHSVVLTHAALFAYLTLIGDAAIGVCLILGLLTPYAAFVGVVLNVNYGLAAGWMNRTDYSLNALLIVVEVLLLALQAGKVAGVDAAVARGSGASRRSRRY